MVNAAASVFLKKGAIAFAVVDQSESGDGPAEHDLGEVLKVHVQRVGDGFGFLLGDPDVSSRSPAATAATLTLKLQTIGVPWFFSCRVAHISFRFRKSVLCIY